MSFRRLMISSAAVFLAVVATASAGERFFPIVPCRAIDTRLGQGGGALNSSELRPMGISAPCAIPSNATAAVVNLTVVGPAPGQGYVIAFAYNTTMPTTSNINFDAGEGALANGATVGLTAGTSNISVHMWMVTGGQLHFVVDVTGYFAP